MYEKPLYLNIENITNYPCISNFLGFKNLPSEILEKIQKYCYPSKVIYKEKLSENILNTDIINLCEEIIFELNDFNNDIFIHIISKCNFVKKIYIIGWYPENTINNFSLQTISKCRYLNELRIDGLKLEKWSIKPIIDNCKYLNVIKFQHFFENDINDGFLTYIGDKLGNKLKQLYFFDINHTQNDMLGLMRKCYNLEKFTYNDFISGGKFNDECFIELGKNNKLLKKLYLNTYSHITDNGLKLFIKNLKNPNILSFLHLGQYGDMSQEEQMINITEDGLIHIARKLKNLKHLELSFRDHGEKYTFKTLMEFSENCGINLRYVKLNYFSNKSINQKNINAFLKKCPNLVEFEINYSWYAMETKTLPYMYSLQKLITGPIPLDFYKTVKEKCPNLKEFHFDRIDLTYKSIYYKR